MSTIKLTPTRAAILRGVAAGQVVHHRTWDRKKPDYDVWTWMAGATRKVTADITKLKDAGLIRVGRATGPSMYATQVWELAPAGQEWLSSNPEEGR